jgi:hypothetical protein
MAWAALVACAQPALGQTRFVRDVSAFAVYDSAGVAIPQPFLGGFNAPRPALVDIDGDGDLDLFVQEFTGRLIFFERTPRGFEWRSDHFMDLDVGEWYRFADVDFDGDMDLFAESPYSHIRYFRNDGSPTVPRFVLAADTLRDVEGQPIFADRQNILQVVDMDCDRRMDLLIGLVSGTVKHYEAVEPTAPGGVPRFQFVQDRWQNIEIVALLPGGPPSSRHGANTMAIADLDGDGDPDLLWGDFFEAGVLLLENRGSCREPVLAEPAQFPANLEFRTTGYNAPAVGDVDGDGDLDILVGTLGGAFNPNRSSIENFHLLEQTAPHRYAHRTTRFIMTLDLGNETAVAAGDIDGDGDVDLLVGTRIDPSNMQTGRFFLLENRGTARAPAFHVVPLPQFTGLYHYAPALGDLDGDGDLDLILGHWRDGLQYWRNEGNGRFVLADSAIARITRGSNTTPTLGDIDGDGDLDLLVGESSGTINFFRNDGTPAEPRFTMVTDEYEGMDVGRRSAPALGDLDGDGDLDLLIGSEDGPVVYRNDGTRREPRWVLDTSLARSLALPPFAIPAIFDIDRDGKVDIVSGSIGGGIVVLRGVDR